MLKKKQYIAYQYNGQWEPTARVKVRAYTKWGARVYARKYLGLTNIIIERLW